MIRSPNIALTAASVEQALGYPPANASALGVAVAQSISLPTGTLLGLAVVRSTSDQGLASTTVLTDATGFTFPLGVSETWQIFGELQVGAALATTGLKLAIAGPASATLDFSSRCGPDALSLSGLYYKSTNVLGGAIDFTAANLISAGSAAQRFSATITANASNAGACKVQFTQSTSSATALTIRKGSWMVAIRVA